MTVIEYLAYQLIDGYKNGDANVTSFLDHYDFYLVPFHNPDGKFIDSMQIAILKYLTPE